MQCVQEIKNLTYSRFVGIKLPYVAEVQPSSHWCVACWLCADAPRCSDVLGDVRRQSRCWEVPVKISTTRLSQSQIRCCKFVPGSRSRCWWAGINSGVVPGFTNHTNCGNHGCVCQQGTITKDVAQPCASLGSTLWTILNGGKIFELRSNQHRKKAFTWYASGSGLCGAYLLVRLVFRRLVSRSIYGFPNWSERNLATFSFKDHFLLSWKRRELR